MTAQLPIKKAVSFRWREHTMSFDVAQALFSSHQVDRGSRMLLDSLDPGSLASAGRAVDFGCGYGVLGIAWQLAKPGWSMTFVDRDALAVAFARHNAESLTDAAGPAFGFDCDITITPPAGGYDLILWNVPGKAGRSVIEALRDVALDSLAPDGVLAVVVVHPLADLFRDVPDREDVRTELVSDGREHTVVHLRRLSGSVVRHDPFIEGAFDRPAQIFEAGDLEWMLTPVIGLPEYDTLSHATMLAIRAMMEVPDDARRWLIVNPGVGHLAVAALLRWPDARGVLTGRDVLALRSSHRAVGEVLSIMPEPIWGLPALASDQQFATAVVGLPERTQSDELAAMLVELEGLVVPGGAVVLHGRSTEIARVTRGGKRDGYWRFGAVTKLRGAAAVTARRL